MTNAWTIYLLSAVIFIAVLIGISWRWPWAKVRYFFYFGLALILLTPVGVSGTNELAPAWLVVVFEFVFGSTDVAGAALKPLWLIFGLYLLVILLIAVVYFRKRSAKTSA